MTLSYLKAQGISWEAGDYSRFLIPGGASYKPMNGPVAGDFSSAAFPAAAAAVSGGELRLLGLDPEDSQGDKVFFTILEEMGCRIGWERLGSPGASKPEWALDISRTGALRGGVFDLNAAPDLLPVLAVTGAFAAGETELVNAAHARIKETDRIAVMAEELGKLGIFAEERPDGLSVRGKGGSGLGGGAVNGRGDHRIVMAFAAGALGAAGAVEIEGAEAAAVTYPGFLELLDSSFL
jgi:3-phosphoshikimate 1-carboxyvinyltransferase